MKRRDFIKGQLIETGRLLELAGEHPLMGPNLRSRREALAAELLTLPPDAPEPKAILYFTGPPVVGSTGIDAEFASSVMEPFARMVKAQYAATKHGIVGAHGPRRDELESTLMLTGLPRGSFGLELTPVQVDSPEIAQTINGVLRDVSTLIESSAVNDDAFAGSIEQVAPRALVALRVMLEAMTNRNAGFRLVTGEREVSLGGASMQQALERVTATVATEREVRMAGVFRGLTLESWRFDFRRTEGEVITGRISDDVTENAAATMAQLTNQWCEATLWLSTVTHRNGRAVMRYELMALRPVPTA